MKTHDSSHFESCVALLTTENQAHQQKIQQLEKIRDELIREKEDRLVDISYFMCLDKILLIWILSLSSIWDMIGQLIM